MTAEAHVSKQSLAATALCNSGCILQNYRESMRLPSPKLVEFNTLRHVWYGFIQPRDESHGALHLDSQDAKSAESTDVFIGTGTEGWSIAAHHREDKIEFVGYTSLRIGIGTSQDIWRKSVPCDGRSTHGKCRGIVKASSGMGSVHSFI